MPGGIISDKFNRISFGVLAGFSPDKFSRINSVGSDKFSRISSVATREGNLDDPHFLDINASETRSGNIMTCGRCPTLTRSRAMSGGFYVSSHRRMLTTTEMFRLQGFPDSRIEFKNLMKSTKHGKRTKVSEREVRGMIGNAMTVPVVGRVVRAACQTCGLISLDLPDPWSAN